MRARRREAWGWIAAMYIGAALVLALDIVVIYILDALVNGGGTR